MIHATLILNLPGFWKTWFLSVVQGHTESYACIGGILDRRGVDDSARIMISSHAGSISQRAMDTAPFCDACVKLPRNLAMRISDSPSIISHCLCLPCCLFSPQIYDGNISYQQLGWILRRSLPATDRQFQVDRPQGIFVKGFSDRREPERGDSSPQIFFRQEAVVAPFRVVQEVLLSAHSTRLLCAPLGTQFTLRGMQIETLPSLDPVMETFE